MSVKDNILDQLPHSFHRLNRETFVFLALLLLSASAWLAVTLKEDDKMELKIPIQLVDVPKKKVILDSECDTLNVRIKDKVGVLVWNYVWFAETEPIRISFAKYDKHNGEVSITANELQRLVQQSLLQTTTLEPLKRDKLSFRYCDGTSKRLPVRLRGYEEASFNFDIKLAPDSITVYAHPDKLRNLHEVYAEEIDFPDNMNASFSCNTAVEKEDAVKYATQEVRVIAKALRLIEKRLEIPIACLNEPEGVKLRLFPSRLAVVVQVDMRMYKNVDEGAFLAVVDFNDIKDNATDNIEVKVVQKPNFVRNVKQERSSVGFLVEER